MDPARSGCAGRQRGQRSANCIPLRRRLASVRKLFLTKAAAFVQMPKHFGETVQFVRCVDRLYIFSPTTSKNMLEDCTGQILASLAQDTR
jgi:hypothetical protein